MVNNSFVNQFFIDKSLSLFLKKSNPAKIQKIKTTFDDNLYYVENLLTVDEIEFLIENSKINKPVGVDGILSHYKEGDVIGSYRGSLYSDFIASIIFNRLKFLYPKRNNFIKSNTDHDNYNDWFFEGINPLLRFIRYKKSGFLIPHYDAPFIKNDNEKSLSTLVIYLTNNDDGETRFLYDDQINLKVGDRDFSDKNFSPTEKDVLLKIRPRAGDAIIFDHRLLHDSDKVGKNEKIIIRTDLMFRRENVE